jgi:hypothetical protein
MKRRDLEECKSTRRWAVKLAAYAAAGTLSTTDASAEIVYTDLGPDGLQINNESFDFDLNNDGATDFTFFHQSEFWNQPPSSFLSSDSAAITPAPANAVAFHQHDGRPAKFSLGEVIPVPGYIVPADRVTLLSSWCRGNSTTSTCTLRGDGAFGFGRGYLGLLFQIPSSNELHAAWVDFDATRGIDLYGFAYETIPGKSIPAGAVPEPPALMLLAAGAAGLAVLRRKRAKREQITAGR